MAARATSLVLGEWPTGMFYFMILMSKVVKCWRLDRLSRLQPS